MLSSLFMAAFAAQVADDGFSKLQIFLQQLIDWGVSAGGRIIGAVIIFVVGRFLISFLRKMLARLLAKKTCGCQYPELCEKFSQYLADHSADYCRYRQIGSGNYFICSFVGICRCGYRYGTFRKLAELCGWIDCTVVPSFQGRRLD